MIRHLGYIGFFSIVLVLIHSAQSASIQWQGMGFLGPSFYDEKEGVVWTWGGGLQSKSWGLGIVVLKSNWETKTPEGVDQSRQWLFFGRYLDRLPLWMPQAFGRGFEDFWWGFQAGIGRYDFISNQGFMKFSQTRTGPVGGVLLGYDQEMSSGFEVGFEFCYGMAYYSPYQLQPDWPMTPALALQFFYILGVIHFDLGQ